MKRIVIVLLSTVAIKLILDFIVKNETYDNAMIEIHILCGVLVVGLLILCAYNTQKTKNEELERNKRRKEKIKMESEKKLAEKQMTSEEKKVDDEQ